MLGDVTKQWRSQPERDERRSNRALFGRMRQSWPVKATECRKRCVGEVVYNLLKYSLTLEAINFRRSAKKVS